MPTSPHSFSPSLHRRGAVLALAWLGLAAPFALHAQATTDIQGPVSIVVGYPAGGSSDRAARLLADALAPRLGVPVVVENRPGAGGRVAAQQVKAAPADRPVLMLANPAVMVVAPLVFTEVGYDPQGDFTPVSHLISYDFALAVSPELPVTDVRGLLAWLKEHPRSANIGVPATGSLPHFFALMLEQQANVTTEVIGYNGSAPLLSDLIGGQIPVAVDTEDAVLPQHQGGKLRMLAVSGEQRSAWVPDVPTFKEAGLDLVASGWNVLYAPASMPAERVDALAQAVHEVMQDEALRKRFDEARITPVGSTQARTREMLQAFEAQWAPVVQTSGYRP